MADGTPLPFPSPSAILGENAPSPDPDPPPPPPPPPLPPPTRPAKHVRRPSGKDNNNPKKATPKKGPAVDASILAPDAVKDGSVVKPKQTKSRNGCATCKLKRLKCGEEKPACQNCVKRNVQCGGYKKVFQWRDYGSNNPVKVNHDKQKQPTHAASPTRDYSADSSKCTTPSVEVPPRLSGGPRLNNDLPKPEKTASAPRSQNGSDRPRERPSRTPSPKDDPPAPPGSATTLTGTPEVALAQEIPPGGVSFNPDSIYTIRTRSFSRGTSPTWTEFVRNGANNDNDAHHQDFVPFSIPDDYPLPLWSAGSQEPGLMDETLLDDDIDNLVGPIQPMDIQPFLWPSQYNTPSSSHSNSPRNMLAQMNSQSPLYNQLDFPFDSTEALTIRFDRLTCGILSVMDGPNENPWRTLVWPMATHSPGLFHAIMALTAFHAASENPRFKVVGGEHKEQSLAHIRDGIRDSSMGYHTAIATALALGFAESWDRHTDTGNSHIKGAQALVKVALNQHQMEPLRGEELARLKFCCNAWVYMDVMARLTSVDCDESSDFDKALWTTDDRDLIPGNEQPGFGINFGMPIDARLDPLMGCAGTLFPLIGHVANLCRKVCRSQTNSPGIISQARDLMESLEAWDPPAYIERPEDPSTDVQHALQTAEAYRYATLLHLHQAVPELPTPFTDEQFAQRVLQYLATVPLSSRTMNVHVYPMMVAGCQASELDDREWVRGRWAVMANRLRIGVIDKCLAVTEEVWRRKDDYEAKPPRQRKLVATADLDPNRRRGQPLERKGSESPKSNPGRTGVVFSYVETDGDQHGHDINRPGSARPARITDAEFSMGKIDMAYTIRGHLHWVGVMWDWGWEVLLG